MAYSEILLTDAIESHRWNVLYAAVSGAKKVPEMPSIMKLRGING